MLLRLLYIWQPLQSTELLCRGSRNTHSARERDPAKGYNDDNDLSRAEIRHRQSAPSSSPSRRPKISTTNARTANTTQRIAQSIARRNNTINIITCPIGAEPHALGLLGAKLNTDENIGRCCHSIYAYAQIYIYRLQNWLLGCCALLVRIPIIKATRAPDAARIVARQISIAQVWCFGVRWLEQYIYIRTYSIHSRCASCITLARQVRFILVGI